MSEQHWTVEKTAGCGDTVRSFERRALLCGKTLTRSHVEETHLRKSCLPHDISIFTKQPMRTDFASHFSPGYFLLLKRLILKKCIKNRITVQKIEMWSEPTTGSLLNHGTCRITSGHEAGKVSVGHTAHTCFRRHCQTPHSSSKTPESIIK